MRYCFSGHESFYCKTLWLKKGYDFLINNNNFNAADSVAILGVGKNMVSGIRYWMRSFGLTIDDKLTEIATYLFDEGKGKDPYVEDLGTLWLLHYLLVRKGEATLYNWLFCKLQRERKHFERHHVVNFVHRILVEEGKQNIYNENTVRKDVGTLIQSYVLPTKAASNDDYSALLQDLDLIRTADGKIYEFNQEGKRQIPWQIFLYAILDSKGTDQTVSYDVLQECGMMFCMNDIEVIEMCQRIESEYPNSVRYSDTAGIRQLQFINDINKEEVIDEYYD